MICSALSSWSDRVLPCGEGIKFDQETVAYFHNNFATITLVYLMVSVIVVDNIVAHSWVMCDVFLYNM